MFNTHTQTQKCTPDVYVIKTRMHLTIDFRSSTRSNTLIRIMCMTGKEREALEEKKEKERGRSVIGDLGGEILTVVV